MKFLLKECLKAFFLSLFAILTVIILCSSSSPDKEPIAAKAERAISDGEYLVHSLSKEEREEYARYLREINSQDDGNVIYKKELQ